MLIKETRNPARSPRSINLSIDDLDQRQVRKSPSGSFVIDELDDVHVKLRSQLLVQQEKLVRNHQVKQRSPSPVLYQDNHCVDHHDVSVSDSQNKKVSVKGKKSAFTTRKMTTNDLVIQQTPLVFSDFNTMGTNPPGSPKNKGAIYSPKMVLASPHLKHYKMIDVINGSKLRKMDNSLEDQSQMSQQNQDLLNHLSDAAGQQTLDNLQVPNPIGNGLMPANALSQNQYRGERNVHGYQINNSQLSPHDRMAQYRQQNNNGNYSGQGQYNENGNSESHTANSERYYNGGNQAVNSDQRGNLLYKIDEILSKNSDDTKVIKFFSPKPKRPLNLLPEGTKANFGQKVWLSKHEQLQRAKNYGNLTNLQNSLIYKPKLDEINNRYQKKITSRKGSFMREQGAKILAGDDIDNSQSINVNDSVPSSPKKRKKIVWRDETDKLNQLSQGIEVDPSKMTALENSQKLNYGDRFGRNVIDGAYNRQNYACKLFN